MTRKRHLTARIKPATKHALMAQLALAADVIEAQRVHIECLRIVMRVPVKSLAEIDAMNAPAPRPWWRRLLGLR